MMRIAKLFGRAFLSLAGLAFLVGVSLFVIGSYLVTWPILRLPPRERRVRAAMEVGSALVGAMIALRPPTPPPEEESTDSETSRAV